MQHAEFVHLHVHSEYSLLDGAARLEKLVQKAKDLHFPAIALTDHGNMFGAIDFYLAAQKAGVKPLLGCELYVPAGTLGIARSVGPRIVGTNDSPYLEGGHAKAHEALLCIQTGTNLNDPSRFRFASQEFYVKSAEEMARVFAELPEACRNTLAVAERCNLTLDFGSFHLPRYVAPEGHTLDSYLHELARAGLRRRYGPSPGDAIETRLAHELAVIEKMGFAGYFLVVWDFIRFPRERGIAVGPGRASSP